jgi:hypothetical protein
MVTLQAPAAPFTSPRPAFIRRPSSAVWHLAHWSADGTTVSPLCGAASIKGWQGWRQGMRDSEGQLVVTSPRCAACTGEAGPPEADERG